MRLKRGYLGTVIVMKFSIMNFKELLLQRYSFIVCQLYKTCDIIF
jgi:hypothetical protein